jgi:hypothetical protein
LSDYTSFIRSPFTRKPIAFPNLHFHDKSLTGRQDACATAIHLHQWDASKPIAFPDDLFTKRSMMMTDRNNSLTESIPSVKDSTSLQADQQQETPTIAPPFRQLLLTALLFTSVLATWQIANLPTKYAPILPKQVQAQREL